MLMTTVAFLPGGSLLSLLSLDSLAVGGNESLAPTAGPAATQSISKEATQPRGGERHSALADALEEDYSEAEVGDTQPMLSRTDPICAPQADS